ncbi:hypothetical protein [Fodinicola acaciae]|uniref:hypothetical protein n=1 Tax=Fodinicola acaciae TaxID=2681555 RepID=UPI0013D5A66A|nr:hypothetical protein [Fodinicola acaciae]
MPRIRRLAGAVALTVFLAMSASGATARAGEEKPPAAPQAGLAVSYWVDGLSTINKLDSSIVVGRGHFDSMVDLATGKITGDLHLPPSKGQFLAFRFMPVGAVTDFIPAGPSSGTITAGIVDITSEVYLRTRDANQNGVPLDLGAECVTSTPVKMHIRGPLNLLGKSEFDTTYAIPPFVGCGGKENLDRLLTAMISGPDNALHLTLTFRCSGVNCS